MAQEPTDQTASADQAPVSMPESGQGVPAEGPQMGTGEAEGSPAEEIQSEGPVEQADQEAMPGEDEALEEAELTDDELARFRANEVAFSWQASEYVHHHKGAKWYAGLGLGATVLGGVAIWLQDWLAVVAFVVMAGAIVVYARRPPRILTYELTRDGVTIEGKAFLYSEFRSFGVLPDEEWHSIDLVPIKRFVPKISLLFEDEDFESIVGHLELHLPRIDQKPDLVDRVSRYLRF